MSNTPIQEVVESLRGARADTSTWADEVTSTARSTAAQLRSRIDGTVDPEIATRCGDALDAAVAAVDQAVGRAAEQVAANLDAEISRVESVLR